MGRLQIVGGGVDDLPRQPLFAQPLIDHATGLAAVHPEMAQAQEGLQIQSTGNHRMVPSQRNLQGFAAPEMTGEACGNFIETAQHQIELAAIQGIDWQTGRQWGDVQAQVRGAVLQASQQAGHAQLLDEIGHGDTKALAAVARVKAFVDVEGLFDLLQGRANRTLQRQGLGRRLHAPADAHQQRVIEQLAQARQGVTHGWLAEGQALGGTGDVLFTQQHIEDAQQIEVEIDCIHIPNITHMKMKFLK